VNITKVKPHSPLHVDGKGANKLRKKKKKEKKKKKKKESTERTEKPDFPMPYDEMSTFRIPIMKSQIARQRLGLLTTGDATK